MLVGDDHRDDTQRVGYSPKIWDAPPCFNPVDSRGLLGDNVFIGRSRFDSCGGTRWIDRLPSEEQRQVYRRIQHRYVMPEDVDGVRLRLPEGAAIGRV
jgi:hypothetical protein